MPILSIAIGFLFLYWIIDGYATVANVATFIAYTEGSAS